MLLCVTEAIDMTFIRFIIILILLLPTGVSGTAFCAGEADGDTLQPYLQTLRADPDNAGALRAMGLHLLHHADYEEARKYVADPRYPMSGYQLMVRGELFRGRYREGFDSPKAFTPDSITPVKYTLYDVAHTFLPGHRLMIQVQSSWFPIIDRNPQKFIDTYHCSVEDFEMRMPVKVYHQKDAASRIVVRVAE